MRSTNNYYWKGFYESYSDLRACWPKVLSVSSMRFKYEKCVSYMQMLWSTNKWLKSTLPSLSIHLFSLWIFNIIPPGCRPLCLYLWCVQLWSDSLISQCCSPPAQSCYTLSFSGYRVNMKGVLSSYILWTSLFMV